MTVQIEVPFLVVGAGPTGMTLARLLATLGHECLVVERREGPQTSPSAHVVNARTLEIFRHAGFDMEAIGRIAKRPSDAGHVNFVTRLNGDLIGRLPFERQGDECLAHTPTPLRNISQHRLEPLLARAIATTSGVDLRYGVGWVRSTSDDDGVTSVLRLVGTDDEFEVRSAYLLAADGAGSAVRKSLGIEMVGPASIQDFVAIHVLGDLRRYVAERPGVLHFTLDPEASGTFIAHDLDREWVFMTTYDRATQTIDDFDPVASAALVRAAIGDAAADIEVVGSGTWHMTAQVAEQMRSGRVFLVGDAAHRFPPTGGLGLNTGVADAHNLAWKLAAVEDGWAAPALLDSYDVERRPVAHVNCQQSLTNAFKMVLLGEALGLHPGATSADLQAAIDDPSRADAIAAAVHEQATHFDMLGLQLGHVYAEGALVRDGAPPPPLDDPGTFVASADPGARLPHAWLADGRSTLDLVGGRRMTLLSSGEHDRWADAVAASAAPIDVVRLGVDAVPTDSWYAQCGLGDGGALLVRPDQHVAWRADQAPPLPAAALAGALGEIIG